MRPCPVHLCPHHRQRWCVLVGAGRSPGACPQPGGVGVAVGRERDRLRQSLGRVVFGPALWATGNGGTTWYQEKLGGPVLSLTTAGSYVYAAVGSCYETSNSCSPTVKLERSLAQQNVWHAVAGISGHGAQVLLASQGASVWAALWPSSAGPASVWASANRDIVAP